MGKESLMTEGIEPITSLQTIIDRGFTPARGKMPRTDEEWIEVLARGGYTYNGLYLARQLDWRIRDHSADPVGWRLAK